MTFRSPFFVGSVRLASVSLLILALSSSPVVGDEYSGLNRRERSSVAPSRSRGTPVAPVSTVSPGSAGDLPPERTPEAIAQQLRNIQDLAGPAPTNPVAASLERQALVAGATFAPTPDGLGAQGCMAALSVHVITPALAAHGRTIPKFWSTARFVDWVRHQSPPIADVITRSIDDLRSADLRPGDIVVGRKGDGDHAMVWTRAPRSWNWNPAALIAVGNTGLPQFGPPSMRLAQEYISPGLRPGEEEHNAHHGMINSRRASNPYRIIPGASFTIIRLRAP